MSEVIIRRQRMLLVLQEDEIIDLIKRDPNLWAVALKRGKFLSRYEKGMDRRG